MTLKKEVSGYKNDFLPRLNEMDLFYKRQSGIDAIRYAAEAIDPNGKMNNHQWRVGKANAKKGAEELLKLKNKILKSTSFEEIFILTEEIRKQTYGLGDLWSYDTALRIGFKLNIYPEKVYIQAGVVKGAKKALGKKFYSSRALPISIFPNEIQVLKPYQAENFLCIWGKDRKSSNC